ncbi:hypothetical protein CVT26_014193 [Gymnopilus dilepis]|uniref:Uncharacterized protein n=1 Tax=Gymnopilus dilepis TaxID=231916 RepID=A0A409VXC5_9AGAR|nr:hypothetical protein CVT26_014193 [Gymnopilus dilepis]
MGISAAVHQFFLQLRTLFNCDADAEFEIVKDVIRMLCDKYLDVALPATRQREKLERVMKKLGKHAWFAENGERRLHFARKTVHEYHYKKCCKERHRRMMEDSEYDPNSDAGDASDSDEFDDLPLSGLGVAIPPAVEVVGHNVALEAAEEPVNVPLPPDFLTTFLASCNPDMTRYLETFRKLGFDEESLRAFSGPNWTMEDRLEWHPLSDDAQNIGSLRGISGAHWTKERANLVQEILKSLGSEEVNKMHVCILEHHLLNHPGDQGHHRGPAMLSSPNAEFEDTIKDGIIDLCDKYLVALPVRKQRDNAEKVFSQVIQNPWFFKQDTKHRRSLARKAIRDYQYSRYRKSEREPYKLELSDEDDDSEYIPSSEDEERVENKGDDDEYEDHLDDTPVSGLVRHPPLGKVVNKPSPRRKTTEPIAPVDFVKGFLSSCKPSMMEYESRFRNFKADEDTLRGAAGAHWTKDERASLVRRILKSSAALANKQGYLRDRAMFSQLRTLFPVEAEFLVIKDRIIELCDKYLDVALSVSHQPEKFRRVLDECAYLKVGQDPIFLSEDKEHRLHFARNTIREYQYRRVNKARNRNQKRPEQDGGHNSPARDKNEVGNEELRSEVNRLAPLRAMPLTALAAQHTSRKATNKASLEKEMTEPDEQFDFIRAFLSSCKPSMVQYEDRFRGFKADEATLRGAAGVHWTKEERANLVREILKFWGSEDRVNEMHVCVLEHHLRNYQF